MTANAHRRPPRRGVATIWALVVLSVVSVFSAVAVTRFVAVRRQLDAHRNRLQADWLARAGYELAVARVLSNPEGYAGESVALIPGSEVKITVRKEPGTDGGYRVDSEARYPAGGRETVVRTIHRAVKRVVEPKGVRVESVPVDP
ncbi:hypothetical protein [Fimbriiglobus ruber]|uniref:Uncharacterized protein n=1 Tax=Fimbriiglobus ruber TaxID=1908690 RepID=A0A225E5F7_9BACT|nr:hypothetical protein [Fimbriiglobus ruber]OWK47004.1 hypothetical protein FRUB_00703 [Fimbriiglobus ruber]